MSDKDYGWDVVSPQGGDGDFLPGQPFPGGPVPNEPPGQFHYDMHTQPMQQIAGNPKHAAGIAKPQINLVPTVAMVYMAKVFELGAKKYGPFNWRDAAVVRSIYLAAAARHLFSMMDGQDLDEESGLPHSAHIQACMAILQDAENLGQLVDDRPKPGPVPAVLRNFTEKAAVR